MGFIQARDITKFRAVLGLICGDFGKARGSKQCAGSRLKLNSLRRRRCSLQPVLGKEFPQDLHKHHKVAFPIAALSVAVSVPEQAPRRTHSVKRQEPERRMLVHVHGTQLPEPVSKLLPMLPDMVQLISLLAERLLKLVTAPVPAKLPAW